MTITARKVHYTYEQYVALEDASTIRHEYVDGEIYAMAGGSPDHAALAANVIRVLGGQLPSGCRIFTSDLRIRIPATGLSTYPDAAVVCGGTARASDDRLAVTNPVLLVEVTSPSTEDYDRGEKLRHYTHLASVKEVLILSHREPRVTLHRRDGDRWAALEAERGGTMQLGSLPVTVAVDDLYQDGLEDASPGAR
jgi:Uma2 family endonuclease